MDRVWGGRRFTSVSCQDDEAGWSAVDLHLWEGGEEKQVARICFWDAVGQFTIQAFSKELPLPILEELILEAKEKIRLSEP